MSATTKASNFMRSKVSKKKRRYIDKQNGFDLDLSYITPNIIAMGFPSEGMEGAYRNPYSEVIRFLDMKHKDGYKVYNLCSERGYDPIKFYNRVGCFPFDDHNAPPFSLIPRFCEDVKEFLDQNENNLAVIHCKAGKGRTGLLICCFLIFSGEWGSTDEAMSFYAAMRTYNKKGVTIPSQIRYIRYFERSLKMDEVVPKKLTLLRVVLHGAPYISKGAELVFRVLDNDDSNQKTELLNFTEKVVPKTKKKSKKKTDDDNDLETIVFDCQKIPVFADVKVEVNERTTSIVGRVEESPVCAFWFHTAFIDDGYMIMRQVEIDKVNKDKNNKIVPRGFHIEAFFGDESGNEIARSDTPPEATSAAETTTTSAPVGGAHSDLIDNAEPATPSPLLAPELSVLEDKPLNRLVTWNEKSTTSPQKLGAWLLSEMMSLYGCLGDAIHYELFLQNETSIMAMKYLPRFKAIVLATAELQKVDLKRMLSTTDRLSFWINMANLILLHGFVEYGIPRTRKQRATFETGLSYEIGGHRYSLADIEHSMLRGPMTHPQFIDGIAVAYPKLQKKHREFAVDTIEPRINFALALGTVSGPRLMVYPPESVLEVLEENATEYIQKNSEFDQATNTITLPKILNWYQKDFGPQPEHMLQMVSVYLDQEIRDKVSANLRAVNIKYSSYNWGFYYNIKQLTSTTTLSNGPASLSSLISESTISTRRDSHQNRSSVSVITKKHSSGSVNRLSLTPNQRRGANPYRASAVFPRADSFSTEKKDDDDEDEDEDRPPRRMSLWATAAKIEKKTLKESADVSSTEPESHNTIATSATTDQLVVSPPVVSSPPAVIPPAVAPPSIAPPAVAPPAVSPPAVSPPVVEASPATSTTVSNTVSAQAAPPSTKARPRPPPPSRSAFGSQKSGEIPPRSSQEAALTPVSVASAPTGIPPPVTTPAAATPPPTTSVPSADALSALPLPLSVPPPNAVNPSPPAVPPPSSGQPAPTTVVSPRRPPAASPPSGPLSPPARKMRPPKPSFPVVAVPPAKPPSPETSPISLRSSQDRIKPAARPPKPPKPAMPPAKPAAPVPASTQVKKPRARPPRPPPNFGAGNT